MSVFDSIHANLAVPAMMDVLGDTVIRRTAAGATETLTGIWAEKSISDGREQGLGFDPATRDTTTGERGVRIGLLQVRMNQVVAVGDQWTIKGEVWQLAPHEWLGSVSGGLRTLFLRRDEKSFTREHSRNMV